MDDPSLDDLFSVVYEELRRLAGGMRPSDSVTPTTLVHEAYMRLERLNIQGDWDVGRLRVVASAAMRSVLVDRARARLALKRGGDLERVTLTGVGRDDEVLDVLALHEAMLLLRADDPVAHRIVEMRFFGGFSNPDIADALGLPLRTVERQWRAARALLHHLLSDG